MKKTVHKLTVAGALLLGACSALQLESTTHYRLTPAHVDAIAATIEAQRCRPGTRVYVVGAEVRADGSLDLAVTCR